MLSLIASYLIVYSYCNDCTCKASRWLLYQIVNMFYLIRNNDVIWYISPWTCLVHLIMLQNLCVHLWMLFCSSRSFPRPVLCSVKCHGDEDKLKDCYQLYSSLPGCDCGDIVAISCSKFNSLTKTCNHVISQPIPWLLDKLLV